MLLIRVVFKSLGPWGDWHVHVVQSVTVADLGGGGGGGGGGGWGGGRGGRHTPPPPPPHPPPPNIRMIKTYNKTIKLTCNP